MSCWVVPSLAAEVWQIPLHEVLRRIREGQLAVREEDGFTFVDVAPFGPRIERPLLPPRERPATYVPVAQGVPLSDDEISALGEQPSVELEVVAELQAEDDLPPVDETESEVLGDWRAARSKVARKRIPPPPRRLSA